MAIIVSGTYIKFDSGSVAQSEFFDEAFGTGVFPESGNITIGGRTKFDSRPSSPGIKISSAPEATRKTSAPVTISSPASGTVTVAPIVSTVYVYAVGGGGGAAGITGPATYGAGTAGTPSFFSTVIGGGGGASSGIPGGTGGPATGGSNTPGVTATNAPTAPGVDALPGGASGTGAAGGDGGSAPTPGTGPGGTGALYGGGGGGAEHIPSLTAFRSGGGGGGGFALNPAFPVVGGSPYPYQSGVGGPGGPGSAVGGRGGDGRLILEFFA